MTEVLFALLPWALIVLFWIVLIRQLRKQDWSIEAIARHIRCGWENRN